MAEDPGALRIDTWKLETTSLQPPYYSSYLGNGYLGVQVSKDGTGVTDVEKLYQSLPKVPVKSYIAGLYDGGPEQLVEIPRWSAVRFNNGEGWLSFDEIETITGYRQVLDMRNACFRTQYTWEVCGRATDFDITFFVSREDAHLAVLRFAFVPHYDGGVVLENSLDAETVGNLSLCARGSDAGGIWIEVMIPPSDVRIAQALGICGDGAGELRREVDLSEAKQVAEQIRFNVENGRRYVFVKYVSFFISYDSQAPLRDARQEVKDAEEQGYDRLFEAHSSAWAELWESDILVDDSKWQRRIHSAMYHLLSSVRAGQDHSIPPMGLSFNGWGGKIFWDAEFFMFPALVLLHPELARSIVMYRYRILDAARANAEKEGYEGAAYDWATGRTGKGLGFFRPGGLCPEIHIIGEVAWAQWQFYQATGDRSYLEKCAGPIIIETARFWASKVTCNENANRYEILGVIPPDESITNPGGPGKIDNSLFTNVIARWNLRTAIKVCEMLGREYPAVWEDIANKMYLPFDPGAGVYLEYDGYSGHPIKQPDVAHMIYPLEDPMSPEEVARHFDYYKQKADRNLSHSFFPSVHPIVACRLGRREEAYELFQEWEGFFLPPFEAMRECLANEYRVFVTSFGGFLQNFLYGFAGIRIGEDGLMVQPVLPDELPRITFKRIFFGGKAYRLTVGKRDGQERYEFTEHTGLGSSS